MKERRHPRGFTIIELAIVLTISAALVPMAFVIQRSFEVNQYRALARVDAARAASGVSEELRKDLRTHRFDRGMQLSGVEGDPCSNVAYAVGGDGALTRKVDAACGATRVIARGVGGLSRDGDVVTLKLAHRMRDGSTSADVFVFGFAPGSTP